MNVGARSILHDLKLSWKMNEFLFNISSSVYFEGIFEFDMLVVLQHLNHSICVKSYRGCMFK